MSVVQSRRSLELAIPDLSPNLVSRIVELESTQGIGAFKAIEGILATTLNQATFSYGFRVLSRFGYKTEELLAMARQYVVRVRQETENHPDWRTRVDVPIVNSLYIASDTGREGFVRYVRGPYDEFQKVN